VKETQRLELDQISGILLMIQVFKKIFKIVDDKFFRIRTFVLEKEKYE